ncbi:MAG: NlpC/P60 family protein [Rhizobiaceae bacterium]|nr:NlpC/P60 family protein [Rhizobiaceae bacterium]
MNSPPGSLPTLDPLDRRLNAYRSDLADARLRGKVKSEKYTDGKSGRVCVPVANLKGSPATKANTEHQLLLGEEVRIFETVKNWSWVQAVRDGYVGYVEADNVATLEIKPTHVVCVPSTYVYPEAELRSPVQACLSMGSLLSITGTQTVRGTDYFILNDATAVIKKHLRKIDDHAEDFVTVCEQLIHTPYLWGGSSAFGVDCSGLVQLAMRMCAHEVLRDSDMQAATIGEEIEPGNKLENLQRGDLIFWRGHIAIHKGTIHKTPHIVHASGHTMSVAIEPLHEAIERIAYLYEKPIGFRRPQL